MELERGAVELFVEFALPFGAASVGALVAVVDTASERTLFMLAALARAQVRAIAARLRVVDFELSQWVGLASRARGVDARKDKRSFES